jgi:hypothetical protein
MVLCFWYKRPRMKRARDVFVGKAPSVSASDQNNALEAHTRAQMKREAKRKAEDPWAQARSHVPPITEEDVIAAFVRWGDTPKEREKGDVDIRTYMNPEGMYGDPMTDKAWQRQKDALSIAMTWFMLGLFVPRNAEQLRADFKARSLGGRMGWRFVDRPSKKTHRPDTAVFDR